MIWLIVLTVWIFANVVWSYRAFSQNGFLCVGTIFQGIFAAVPNLVVIFSEWMTGKFEFWTYPIFLSKELKDDIEFLDSQFDDLPKMVIHEPDGKEVHFTAAQVEKLGKELIKEVKTQAIKGYKNETKRKSKKVQTKQKKKST